MNLLKALSRIFVVRETLWDCRNFSEGLKVRGPDEKEYIASRLEYGPQDISGIPLLDPDNLEAGAVSCALEVESELKKYEIIERTDIRAHEYVENAPPTPGVIDLRRHWGLLT